MLDKVGEELPGFLGRHSGMDNDIIAWLPVRRSCHLMPVSELKSWGGKVGLECEESS
jgi:hypothetical protein